MRMNWVPSLAVVALVLALGACGPRRAETGTLSNKVKPAAPPTQSPRRPRRRKRLWKRLSSASRRRPIPTASSKRADISTETPSESAQSGSFMDAGRMPAASSRHVRAAHDWDRACKRARPSARRDRQCSPCRRRAQARSSSPSIARTRTIPRPPRASMRTLARRSGATTRPTRRVRPGGSIAPPPVCCRSTRPA